MAGRGEAVWQAPPHNEPQHWQRRPFRPSRRAPRGGRTVECPLLCGLPSHGRNAIPRCWERGAGRTRLVQRFLNFQSPPHRKGLPVDGDGAVRQSDAAKLDCALRRHFRWQAWAPQHPSAGMLAQFVQRSPSAMKELILASSSTHRRTLLQRLGLPFQAISPNIDESPIAGGDAPCAGAAAWRGAKRRRWPAPMRDASWWGRIRSPS